MKFVYFDETGLGEEPIAIMVGIIADSYRMRLTKQHWDELLKSLSDIVGREITEIHTKDFYPGNGVWHGLNGNVRAEIISKVFNWLDERKHSIVYTVVDKTKFFSDFKKEPQFDDIKTLWRFMAMHVSLALQKKYQGSIKGKNRKLNTKENFVLVFDNEYRDQKHFTDLILNPPDWTDSYYNKQIKQEKFNQIVDVPHFVDSKDVGLIQLADFVCFFLRRYIELKLGLKTESYAGELEKITNWVNIALSQSIPKSNIYLSKGRCSASDLFFRYSHEIIRN